MREGRKEEKKKQSKSLEKHMEPLAVEGAYAPWGRAGTLRVAEQRESDFQGTRGLGSPGLKLAKESGCYTGGERGKTKGAKAQRDLKNLENTHMMKKRSISVFH